MDCIEPDKEVRIALIQLRSLTRGFKQKAHHDIGDDEAVAREPVPFEQFIVS